MAYDSKKKEDNAGLKKLKDEVKTAIEGLDDETAKQVLLGVFTLD